MSFYTILRDHNVVYHHLELSVWKPCCDANSIFLSRPGKGHTELEEELHETAHIDYDRVAIVSTLQSLSDC